MYSIFEKNNSYILITAFYAISLSEFHMSTHSHKSCEIMYVTNGSCTIQCNAEKINLTQNQFIFLDAGVPHKLFITQGQPCSILNIEFLCQAEESMVSLYPLRESSPDFSAFCKKKTSYVISNDLRSLGYALKDLIAYLQKNPVEHDYLLYILFHRTMLELSYCTNQYKKSTGTFYIKKACAYIEENLFTPIKIQEIAEYTGINKSYLQLLFSRFLHCTITGYINQKRMEQAVFLLTNSTMKIIDIAFSTGYNSRQHFAHTFERYYNMGPQKYRKLHSRTLLPDTGEKQYLLDRDSKVKAIHLK